MKPLNPHLWRVFACLTLLGLALSANFQRSAERAFMTEDDLIPADFPVFYIGGKVALQRGATPLYYPPSDRSQWGRLLYEDADPATPWAQMARANGIPHLSKFTNPPFTALLMAPLAKLPWQRAYLLWQIIIILLTAGATFLTLKLRPSEPRVSAAGSEGSSRTPFGPTLVTFSFIFAAICCFFAFQQNLVLGQVNVCVLFTWTLGVYLLAHRRTDASALCFALGTAVKVSPLVAVPLLALRRQWRWLATYAGAVAGLSAVSIWVLGWQTHRIWLTEIYPSISAGLGNLYNRSLAGLLDVLWGPAYSATLYNLTQWQVPRGLGLFEKACSLAIGLGFLFWCWRRRQDAKGIVDELILLPLVYLLAAPFSWDAHFILALLPLTYLWAKAREATAWELVALFLSTLIMGSELPMYLAAYSPWAGPHLITLAIALWPAATCAILWVGMRMYARESCDK